MAKWNAAAIIAKILRDDVGKRLLKDIENIPKRELEEMLERFKNEDLTVQAEGNPKVRKLFGGAQEATGVVVAGKDLMQEKPTPEQWASYMASVPEDVRKNTTYIIGGAESHARALGAKVVWDANK